MGLRFRKSVNFGPLRINFSKSGVGYSVGGKGFRITKTAKGTIRKTTSIPGTGISYVEETSLKSNKHTTNKESNRSNPIEQEEKKPIFQKWWFWAVIIFAAIIVFSLVNRSDNAASSQLSGNKDSYQGVSSSASAQQDEPEATFTDETVINLIDNVYQADQISKILKTNDKVEVSIQVSEDDFDAAVAEQSAQQACMAIKDGLGLSYAVIYLQDDEGSNLISVLNGKTTYNALISDTEETENEVYDPLVWVSASGTKYHSSSSCSNMSNPSQMTLSSAISAGYTACQKCY